MKRWWLLLVGIWLAVMPWTALRWQWERAQDTVSLLFDSREAEQLAREEGLTLSQWLTPCARAGLTGLALWPETLPSLQDRSVLTWLTRRQALSAPDWRQAYPGPVQEWLVQPGEGVLIVTWEESVSQWVSAALRERQIPFRSVEGEEMSYLLVEGGSELGEVPLGMWPETVAAAERLGLTCCAVLSLPQEENDLALAQALYGEWEALGIQTLLGIGGGLPGYGQARQAARAQFDTYVDWGGQLALVESSDQVGSLDFPGKEEALARQEGLLRCGYAWDYVADRYGVLGYSNSQEVSLALARAAGERNCRILWLTAMTEGDTGEPVEEASAYSQLLQQLQGDLARFGLRVGEAASGPWISGLPVRLAQVLSWGTGTGAGCLCAWLLLGLKRGWGQGILAQLTALTGGVAAAGWLNGSLFFLGEESFRGVKLAQLVPLGWFLLLWCHRRWRQGQGEVRKWLRSPVTGRTLLLAGGTCLGLVVLAGVGVYYLARTGNSGLATQWELRLRNELEIWWGVRPRFKEFVVGLPCLVLWNGGDLPVWMEPVAGLGAMIGLVSVTNTFLHLFTPLSVSLLRTGVGWLLGGILGLVLLGLVFLGRRLKWPTF